jgi:hypothetical protein
LPKCGGAIEVVAFVTDHKAVGRTIDHMKLTFIAEKQPLSPVLERGALMPAKEGGKYF